MFKKIGFVILALAVSNAYGKSDSKLKVRCRKNIHGKFAVDKFDNWTIVANDMESSLTGVSIQAASPGLSDAVPDDIESDGKMSGTWKVTKDNTWLVCHHSKLKMVIEQKLPAGLKSCKAKEQPDAVAIECN